MSELKIRELQKKDLQNGFLTTLDALRIVSNIDKNKAEEVFEKINSNPNHIIVIAELDERIIGSATLLIEPKFIHDGGLVGHIEDVVVKKDFQGEKIGNKIIKFLLEFARDRGCYKTILNCTDDVKEFYEKIGFIFSANELRFNHI
jgi:glucosamine-phosphate N-acetyltransferase